MKSSLSQWRAFKAAIEVYAASPIAEAAKKSLILAGLLAMGGAQTRDMIPDAWASATTPVAPSLRIAQTFPAMVNNTINVFEGQAVTICVSATDPDGHSSVSLKVNANNAFPNETSFVNSPCAGGTMVKEFTLNTQKGDAAKYPNGTEPLTFTASNTYNGHTDLNTFRTIQIAVLDLLQPSFDAIAADHTVTVGEPFSLPIVANADDDADAVSITATNMPKNATLTQAAKDASGKWVSYFNWTPSEADYETLLANSPNQLSHKVSFFAQDEVVQTADQVQPNQTDVTFTLVPPIITDAAINQLQVNLLTWDAAKGILSATGRVKFAKHIAVVRDLGILLSDPDTGLAVTKIIPVNDNGLWHISQTLGTATMPCKLTATIVHITDSGPVNASTTPITHPLKQTPAAAACKA